MFSQDVVPLLLTPSHPQPDTSSLLPSPRKIISLGRVRYVIDLLPIAAHTSSAAVSHPTRLPPQTLGGRFQVDGRWKGAEVVQTVPCDQTTNACTIRVPAPGVALVFISDDAKSAVSSIDSQPTATFSTSVATRAQQTASIDPSVLATSNGMNGTYRGKGIYGTSKGNDGTAGGIPYILVCVTLVAASFILLGGV